MYSALLYKGSLVPFDGPFLLIPEKQMFLRGGNGIILNLLRVVYGTWEIETLIHVLQ